MAVVDFLGEKTNKVRIAGQKTRSVLLNLGDFANKEEDLHVNQWNHSDISFDRNECKFPWRSVSEILFRGLPGTAVNKFIDMSRTRKPNEKQFQRSETRLRSEPRFEYLAVQKPHYSIAVSSLICRVWLCKEDFYEKKVKS